MTYKLTKPRDYSIEPNKPYSVKDTAYRLGVSPDTIRRMIKQGELNSYKCRSRSLIKGSEILKKIDR